MAAKNHKGVKFGKHDIIGFAVFGVFYFCWCVLLPGKTKAGEKNNANFFFAGTDS